MKRVLLSALAAVTLSAAASEISVGVWRNLSDMGQTPTPAKTFKEKYNVDNPGVMTPDVMARKMADVPDGMSRLTDEMVTDPQGTTTRYAMAVDIYLSNLGATHVGGFGAYAVTSDDGTAFYSKAFTLNFFQQGYTKGDINGDQIVVESGQYVYDTEENERAYMYAAHLNEGEGWPDLVDTFVLTKDEKGRYVSAPGDYLIVMTEEEAENGINELSNLICFGFNYVFTPLPADLTESVMPADAETFTCQIMANSLQDRGNMVAKDVTVGVKDDKIYIGGLCDYLPESYLTGTKGDDNTYTFKTHQYVGYYDSGEYPYIYEYNMVNPVAFDGESISLAEVDEVTMTFNDAHSMLSLEENAGVFISSYGDISSWKDAYWNLRISDFNTPLTPVEVSGLVCYASDNTPYVVFEWSNISKEGIMMMGSSLWCEMIVNGETYTFTPEDYSGLAEATDKLYYDTSDVEGVYVGDYSTVYLYGFKDRHKDVKTLGVRVGFEGNGEVRYSDIVYAEGMEPFDDRAFVPSMPSNLFFYTDYDNKIHFRLDGKDTEGNVIPPRLLAIEILLDGNPLAFKDSDYYFGRGDGPDVTMIGLAEHAVNYNSGSGIVTHYGDEYMISLWGHSELPEFTTLAIRPVCTGGDTFTYGQTCEVVLDRQATPADPTGVVYDEENRKLSFGAIPVDVDGEGLDQKRYGYEVFVNDEPYSFSGTLYGLDHDIALIPYNGFDGNYDFYLNTETIYDETDWSVVGKNVIMAVSMKDETLDIRKIGVRSVYTDGEGNTAYSATAVCDRGAVEDPVTDNGPVKWYNLQGVEVAEPAQGIYIRVANGKTSKIYIR